MLEDIYDEAFFREWGKDNADYIGTARVIAGVIHAQFRPRTVADLGCGCGAYGHYLGELGAVVTSVDGVRPPPEHSFPVNFQLKDLEKPCPHTGELFDLALCLEVAEHIPEENSGVFLSNICSYSGLLLLSAAPPGQGGRHHVNEQPKRYWTERLAARGFHYLRPETGRLVEACKKLKPRFSWMWSQISVYKKGPAPARPLARPFQAGAPRRRGGGNC